MSLLRGVAIACAFLSLRIAERVVPLRARGPRPVRRDARNLAIAAVASAVVALEGALVVPLARLVARRRIGLLKLVPLPASIETALSVVLMDYTLYLWHYLTHRNAFLWRFHEPHHVDHELSSTTALRFHFGELLLSLPFRAVQVVVLGVSPNALSLWQSITTIQILFHHANVRLPLGVERWLSLVLVTPRMHGIHHSVVRRETDSNWSTIFSVFDRWHGTLRLNVPQDEITIGVPAYRSGPEVGLWESLALPFRRSLHAWTRPGQVAPDRPEPELPRDALAP